MYRLKSVVFTFIIFVFGQMNVNPAFAAEKVITYVAPICANRADGEVIESKKFAGKLIGFVWGDYLHGEFVDNNGKQLNLFIKTSDVSCFLAQHKAENLTITYNNLCTYIEEGAGIYPTEEITQITAAKTNFKAWLKGYSATRDSNACEKLERKYTRQP